MISHWFNETYIHQFWVFISLVFIIVSLYKEWIGPAFTFLIAILFLGFTGVLTPNEILVGFANEQIAVVVLLLLLGDIVRRTSILDAFFERVLKNNISQRHFIFRMLCVTAPLSAFFNNTPLVAIMMPYVNNWSQNNKVSPSKLLIPLSYAAILGGCATLIGTSTNLIVNGLVESQNIFPNLQPLGIFDFTYVGLPMVVIGVLYLTLFSNRLLPSNRAQEDSFDAKAQNYIVEAEIRQGSAFINKTIAETQINNIEGLFLAQIVRNNKSYVRIAPDDVLLEGDVLYFAGKTEKVADLTDNKDLTFPEVGLLSKKKNTELVEIVITHNSTLISKTVKEANFRGKYDSAVIAIQRNGEPIRQSMANVKLKAGDVLLLLSASDLEALNNEVDFYFISKVKEIKKVNPYTSVPLLGGLLLAIILAGLGYLSLFLSLTLVFTIILLLKIASPKDVHKNIDYNLIFIIVLSLALGQAMVKTGVAHIISEGIIQLFLPFGVLGLLFGIYFVTNILAAYITNKAAVAIVFPVSLSIAYDMAYNPLPFVLVVAFAAAANFITPIGYQTNLMIYGSGGYRFKDFFKIGLPLSFIYMLVTVFVLYIMYF